MAAKLQTIEPTDADKLQVMSDAVRRQEQRRQAAQEAEASDRVNKRIARADRMGAKFKALFGVATERALGVVYRVAPDDERRAEAIFTMYGYTFVITYKRTIRTEGDDIGEADEHSLFVTAQDRAAIQHPVNIEGLPDDVSLRRDVLLQALADLYGRLASVG